MASIDRGLRGGGGGRGVWSYLKRQQIKRGSPHTVFPPRLALFSESDLYTVVPYVER
jgi:hypothetical protein